MKSLKKKKSCKKIGIKNLKQTSSNKMLDNYLFALIVLVLVKNIRVCIS